MCCFSNIYIYIYIYFFFFFKNIYFQVISGETLLAVTSGCVSAFSLDIFLKRQQTIPTTPRSIIRSATEIAMEMNVVVLQRSQFFEVFAVSLITGQRPNAAGETPSSGEYPKKYKGKVFVERILLCFLQSPEQSKVTGKQQEKDDTFQAQEQGAEELFVLAREAKILQPIAQVASVYCQCSGALDNILPGL